MFYACAGAFIILFMWCCTLAYYGLWFYDLKRSDKKIMMYWVLFAAFLGHCIDYGLLLQKS